MTDRSEACKKVWAAAEAVYGLALTENLEVDGARTEQLRSSA